MGEIAVVCIHGAGGGGWEWGVWARVLGARGFRVAAPDLVPGPRGLAETRLADYRAQVLDACAAARGVVGPSSAELPRRRLVLVGASLGGLLALAAAVPAAADALVLVNPLAPVGATKPTPTAPHPAVVPWARSRSIAGTRRALPDADAAAVLFAYRRWRDESGVALDESRRVFNVEAPRCPLFVLASENDDDVSPVTSRMLAARHGGDFELVRGASHVGPLLGRPAAACAERVAHWLSERLEAEQAAV